MHVESYRDISLSAKTVGELRKMTEWPENLVISTPQGRSSQSAIRVSKPHMRPASRLNRSATDCGEHRQATGVAMSELLQFIIVVGFGALLRCGYLVGFIVTRNRWREMIKHGVARFAVPASSSGAVHFDADQRSRLGSCGLGL